MLNDPSGGTESTASVPRGARNADVNLRRAPIAQLSPISSPPRHSGALGAEAYEPIGPSRADGGVMLNSSLLTLRTGVEKSSIGGVDPQSVDIRLGLPGHATGPTSSTRALTTKLQSMGRREAGQICLFGCGGSHAGSR